MFVVLLDACVLIPPTLTDTVLRIGELGAYGVRWSPDILDEVARTIVCKGSAYVVLSTD